MLKCLTKFCFLEIYIHILISSGTRLWNLSLLASLTPNPRRYNKNNCSKSIRGSQQQLIENRRRSCRGTPRVWIYFFICSPCDYLGKSLQRFSPNSATELGHRASQSVTGKLVLWRMERAEGAGQGGDGERLQRSSRVSVKFVSVRVTEELRS